MSGRSKAIGVITRKPILRAVTPSAPKSRAIIQARLSSSTALQLNGRIEITKEVRNLSSSFGQSRASSSSASPNPATGSPVIPEISIENTYDIVIIGGSNAGLALACALLSQPTLAKTTRILLLEGSSLDKTRSWSGEGEWENRVSSLTAENVSWLDSIGVWKHLEQSRSCPVHEMIIWANPTPESTPTIHFPPLDHPMARMTENKNLQRALLRRIEEIGVGIVDIRENSRVGKMKLGQGDRWVGLKIGDGDDDWVRGSLVIGADGPNSPVRHFSQIESYGHAYQTHAVVATLNHQASLLYPNTTAFQRFLPTGPLAFLPLSSESSTMVWSTLPDHASALKRLSPDALTLMVNAGFTLDEKSLTSLTNQMIVSDSKGTPLLPEEIINIIQTLPTLSPINTEQAILPPTIQSIVKKSIASFPLRLTHADEYLGTRTALVGDAAHTIHPLAGQGLNMGLADVRSISNTLEEARIKGGDLGSKTALANYPRERYPLNHLMLSTTDKLHYIFRNRNPLVNWIRGTGLDLINELTPIKKLLMGGAGSSTSTSTSTSSLTKGNGNGNGKAREFGRSNAKDDKLSKTTGFPALAANGVESWFAMKQVGGMVGGVMGEIAKNGFRRAANVLEKK